MKNMVIKNIFSSWGMYFIISVIRFFLTPLFVHKLGDTDYGIWILILSLIGYLELLNIGVNTANVRYLAKNFETKDHKFANEIFNSGLFIFVILGILIVLSTFSISPFLGYFFDFINKSIIYKVIFIIAGINLAIEFIFYSFSAVLSARQKYFEVNIILTSLFIMRSLVAVILLLTGFKLLAIIINQSVFNIIKGVIISVYSMKTNPSLKINFKYITKVTIKTIGNFSFYIFIINISKKMNLYASSLIIAFVMSPSAVTYFAIANNLINYLMSFILSIPNVLMPRFSQLDAANNKDGIREYYLSFTRITLIISIPIVFIFTFYGGSLISLWIGPKYAEISGPVLAVLSMGALCQISQLTTHSVLKATSRHKKLSYFTFMESISIVILSILLIKPYGLIGLAYAQAVVLAFFNLIVVPIYACREFKIGIVNYYAKYLLINILGLIPLLLIYYFSNSIIIDSIPMFGMIALIIIGAYLFSSYLFTLNMKEKEMLNLIGRLK